MLFTAIILDILMGDPRRIPHIAQLCGSLSTSAEKYLYRGANLRWKGMLHLLVVVSLSLLAYAILRTLLATIHEFLPLLLDVLVVYQCLAARDLFEHVLRVYRPLRRGELPNARRALSMIVGRDTERMNASEISRATIETLAESLNDGVFAPLFWALLAGAPGALIYRCVNTLDSMIGHKSTRYRDYGWASAKMDDVLNYIPARICAFLIIPHQPQAWKQIRREAAQHASPNAGWPESAMAHAIGCKLGGLNYYQQKPLCTPVFHPHGHLPRQYDVRTSMRIAIRSYAGYAALIVFLSSIIR